jgi:DNA-binding beta-propeller fold protein YncE
MTGGAGTGGGSGAAGHTGAAGAAGGNAGAGGGGSSGSGVAGGGGGAQGSGGVGGAGGASGAGGTVSDILPGPFTMSMPTNGSPNIGTSPLLTWTTAQNAVSYDVEVSMSAMFDGPATTKVSGTTGKNALSWTAPLVPGQIYYWRVDAVALGGFSTTASNAPFTMSVPVAVGVSPHGVAVTPNGKSVVVGNDAKPGSVTVLDLATMQATAIGVSGQPGVVAVTPDSKTVLAAQTNTVAVVDLTTMAATGVIASPCVATTLYGLAIKADGSAAVIPDFTGGCINDVLDVVPLPGTAISKALPLGTSATAFGVAVTPDGASALVTRGVTTTSMKRVDLGSGTVTTITGTSSSFGVAVTPDGKTAWVTSGGSDTVKPIDLATNTVGTGLPFESNSEVCNLAIAPDGKHAVVVGSFNIAILTLGATPAVGSMYSVAGRCAAIAADGSRAFVTGAGATGKLYVVKLP